MEAHQTRNDARRTRTHDIAMKPNIKQKGSVAVLRWSTGNFGCTYYEIQDNDRGPILYADCLTDSNHNKKSIRFSFTTQDRFEPYIRATRMMVRELANGSKGYRLVIGLMDASKIVSLVTKELNSLGFEVNNASPQELVGTREIM